MNAQEYLPVPLNDWFFTKDGELTELGYSAVEFMPKDTNEIWKLMRLDRNSQSLPKFLRRCIEHAILDDGTLNFLFPDIGSIAFRQMVENTMAAYCYWPGVDTLIWEIETDLKIGEPDEPFIFYTET